MLIGIPPTLAPGHAWERIYVDEERCVVRADQPGAKRRLSLRRFVGLPQVELAVLGRADARVDRALLEHGARRDVRVVVHHFSAIPIAVHEIRGVATVPMRLARTFASQHGLRILRPPVTLPRLEIRQVWHERFGEDPAVRFLRALIAEAAAG